MDQQLKEIMNYQNGLVMQRLNGFEVKRFIYWDKTYFSPYILTRFPFWSITFFFTDFNPYSGKRVSFLSLPLRQRRNSHCWQTALVKKH